MSIVATQTPGQVEEGMQAESQQRRDDSTASLYNSTQVADRLAAHVRSCCR